MILHKKEILAYLSVYIHVQHAVDIFVTINQKPLSTGKRKTAEILIRCSIDHSL